MNIIDHGNWIAYQPTARETPEGAPPNAMFARRESDGVDWYQYVSKPESFGANTVKFAAIYRAENINGYVVGPATYVADRIFPAGHIVAEITDYSGADPQADLGNKVYDPATGAFSEQPPVPPGPFDSGKLMAALESITTRLDKLEQRK